MGIFSSRLGPAGGKMLAWREKKMNPMVVDSREVNSGIPRLLQAAGVICEQQELPAGDYRIGEILIAKTDRPCGFHPGRSAVRPGRGHQQYRGQADAVDRG